MSTYRGVGRIRVALITATVAVFLASVPTVARSGTYGHVPSTFVVQALCVHAGRHYTAHRYPGARLQYVLYGRGYYLAHQNYDDMPHGRAGNDGEGAWNATADPSYGGGLSFMVGTWNSAGGSVRSTYDIARATPSEQIYRAYVVWKRDGGSWREWPQTSRACGY